jgi:Holliday junction DNA helicase RuvB
MSEIHLLQGMTGPESPAEQFHTFNPRSFKDYIGQDELKQKLHVYVQAAKLRKEHLDHLLLFGPPGLGKTTLAHIMAHELEVPLKVCSGPMMERTGDLVAILSSLEPRGILFIDEIHRMPIAVEEVLYSAMEQFKVDVIIGQGAGAKSVSLPLHPFTLVGATTKSGMISAPLRSRFGIIERFDFYADDALATIAHQNMTYLGMTIEPDAALLIGQAARGTPRIAKRIVRRVRDVAQVEGIQAIDCVTTRKALAFLGIHEDGLTTLDMTLLKLLVTHFKGGPAGLETLASMLGEDAETLEVVYEPFLMRKGLLEKTTRGRQIPHQQMPTLIKKFLGQISIG